MIRQPAGKYFLIGVFWMISLMLLASLIGCSSKGTKDILTPQIDIGYEGEDLPPTSVATSEYSSLGLLGLYDISLDTRTMTAEMVPLRYSSALGDSYMVDITGFLNTDPCPDCVRVRGVELNSDNTITLYIGARHPFPIPVDMSNPQPYDRLDLHVFDVQGIIVIDGDYTFDLTTSDISGDGVFDERIITSPNLLLNADGYTSMFNPYFDTLMPTQANIHPFRIFARNGTNGNYNPSHDPVSGFPYLDNPTGHNVFRQGSEEHIVNYKLDLTPGEHYNFLFALSASYGQSAQGRGTEPGQRLRPRYFLPEFHRKEAWKVDVTVHNNNLRAYNENTTAEIRIEIYDWQHTASVDPNFDPLNSYLTMISRPSSVRDVTVEIPDFGIWLDKNTLPSPSGNASWGSPLRYVFAIDNSSLVSEGSYLGLVTVRDDMEGSETVAGIKRDGESQFLINDFTTYQVFQVDVQPADNPPVPVIRTDPDPPHVHIDMQPILFDASDSTDDGMIILYEWDFDYAGAGSDFAVYATGETAVNIYPVPGHYTVALRVTDDHIPPHKAIATVDIIITYDDLPTFSCGHINSAPAHHVTTLHSSWTKHDGKVDFDFLSNGHMVLGDNRILGRANVTPSGGATFHPFTTGYPGVNIGLIEVDRNNNVIWVEYKAATEVIIGGVEKRNKNRDNRIRVFSTSSNTEIANISLSQYGSYVQAVTTDQANNVWVVMEGNKIIKLRERDYKPVRDSLIRLNEVAGHDIGFVFGLAKNFHNNCFYILTNQHNNGSLYRFEYDFSFNETINGNPNPLDSVFYMVGGFPILEIFGDDALADIVIDNYSGSGYGNILNGEQDCQIVMVACALDAMTQIWASRTVAAADLSVLARLHNGTGFGTHAIGIKPDGSNQLYSIVYGNEPYMDPGCSDNHVDIYNLPAGWH